MEKYKVLEVVGKGSFGEVVKARNTESGEIVAIKKMKQKFATWEECMNLRELKSLRKLQNKNIVKLHEVLRVQSELSFVFEYVELDIYKLYEGQKKAGTKLSESTIRSIFYQLAQALAYMHKHGYFHRDLKPENIMFSGANNSNEGMIKLIDFGLAREIRSRPPYTEYVATRWYRAPELLLQSSNYNSPVDIFALGCIMAELYMFRPLFNGASEQDQLQKLCSVLGTPSKTDWPEGYRLASVRGMSFPQYPSIPLSSVVTDCPSEAVSLISECLRWDPQKRPTAQKILQHSYFRDVASVLPKNYFNDADSSATTASKPTSAATSTPLANTGEIESTQQQPNNPALSSLASNKLMFSNAQQSQPGPPIMKRMSNQFSQSDASIISNRQSRQGQLSNNNNSNNNTGTASTTTGNAALKNFDFDYDYLGSYTTGVNEAALASGKPPLNPSRQTNRSQLKPIQEQSINSSSGAAAPSFSERAKNQQSSGYNYAELYESANPMRIPTGRKSSAKNQSNTSQGLRSNSLQQNSFEPFNAYQGGALSKQSDNNNSSSNGIIPSSIYNFSSNLNSFGRNVTQNPPRVSSRSQMNSKSAIGSIDNPLNLSTTTAAQQQLKEQDDILKSIMSNPLNHQPSSQLPPFGSSHPRAQQTVTSATTPSEKRAPLSNYNNNSTFTPSSYGNNNNNNNNNTNLSSNYTNSGRVNMYSHSPISAMNNYENHGVGQTNKQFGGYGVGSGSGSTSAASGGYLPHKSDDSQQTFQFGSYNNSGSYQSNYRAGSGAATNGLGGGVASGMGVPVYGIKQQSPVSGNPSMGTNSGIGSGSNSVLSNKNIYDFNHVRQPVRSIGLPKY